MTDAKKPPNTTNQAIEIYIQRVTELSQLGQKIPSSQDLLKIAQELGISDEEIQSAQRQSQAHFIRAQGYSTLCHWEDAIDELQEALAFNPFNLPMLHLLINCYLGKWKIKHNSQDEEQIRVRVKQCLEIQPDDQESLKLLAELDKLIKRHQYQLWSLTGLGLLTVGSFMGFIFLNSMSMNILGGNNKKIDEIQQELLTKIENLENEQFMLTSQLLEAIKKQENSQKTFQLEIDILKKEIKELNEENKILIKKLENINKPTPPNPPTSPTPPSPPKIN